MKAEQISIEAAKENKLFYFVVNSVVYRAEDARCLILKRDEREAVHPGKWAVPGGKLEWEDLDLANPGRMNGDVIDFPGKVEELLEREAKEEANIEVDTSDMRYINNVVFVRPDGIPVVLMKFAVRYRGGDIQPEKGAFTDFAWVNAEEVKAYTCIDGICEEVAETIIAFSRS